MPLKPSGNVEILRSMFNKGRALKALLLSGLAVSMGCASGNCRQIREAEEMKNPKAIQTEYPMKTSEADKIKIFKPDGSLQCGLGKSLSLSEMQKEFKNLTVLNSWKRHDGIMRPQVCGAPTGQSNVYEIELKNLEAALKLGFREWTSD